MSSTESESAGVSLNYFTATLGQAARRPRTSFTTVNKLISQQAEEHGDKFACAFPKPCADSSRWECNSLTFRDLYQSSLQSATAFGPTVHGGGGKLQSKCVALLLPSSCDFLLAWLGLMRAGVAVLLIAPQCEPKAIAHLCQTCEASVLIYDRSYLNLATSAKECSQSLAITQIPWQKPCAIVTSLPSPSQIPSVEEDDVAYIHHTSGTSSGLPKPIPQTHRGGVGVLPSLDGSRAASFTTTPLYHGGVADCLRAWTSGAMIWLFPGDACPITTKNVLSCMGVADRDVGRKSMPPVRYFSSVPYVLQMLAEDHDGVRMLQKMEIVGVGGAALPPQVGDELVNQGVRLVSRFGSAECGFLLSSDREFAKDKDWQYLRLPPNSDGLLHFEQHSGDEKLFELIVLPQWPHMAKKNRLDGSFATSDLFELHPKIENAWRYHSRSDSQITLLTGKKFDPAPIEDEIASKSHLIKEVLIFGDGKQVPGALVFLASAEASLDEIWDIFQAVNRNGQNHTRISKERIKIMYPGISPLGRSSKGTLLRAAANERFVQEIEKVYNQHEDDQDQKGELDDQDVKQCVRAIIHRYIGMDLEDDDADFYKCGVDSAMCTQIRSMLQKKLLPEGMALPWNIVYDCGSIDKLSQYVVDARGGKTCNRDTDAQYMLDLVKKYSNLTTRSSSRASSTSQDQHTAAKVVLLTGATGALGAHILHTLSQDTSISSIICLVRATDHRTAKARVLESLKRRRIAPVFRNIEYVPAQLGFRDLGLDNKTITQLHSQVTHIIHAAWTVNFSLPLRSFEDDNIAGLQNLIHLTKSCNYPAHFIFCSSAASVLGKARSTPIQETISEDPSDADTLGYSQSKWVAEGICAAESRGQEMKGVRIKVLRIGQLTGDTINGVWNMTEAWPMMLSTMKAVGCLPRRKDKLSWLPLDIAAQAVVEITLDTSSNPSDSCQVFHILNNSTHTSSWEDLLVWIKEVSSMPFGTVKPSVWSTKIAKLDSHPAKNLLWLWDEVRQEYNGSEKAEPSFDITNAEKRSKAMRSVGPVDKDLVQKIWRWIESETS